MNALPTYMYLYIFDEVVTRINIYSTKIFHPSISIRVSMRECCRIDMAVARPSTTTRRKQHKRKKRRRKKRTALLKKEICEYWIRRIYRLYRCLNEWHMITIYGERIIPFYQKFWQHYQYGHNYASDIISYLWCFACYIEYWWIHVGFSSRGHIHRRRQNSWTHVAHRYRFGF